MRRFVGIFFAVVAVMQITPLDVVVASMSSASFVLPSDTIGDTGGQTSSTSFILNDTLGDIGGGTGQGSTSFVLNSGFQTMAPEPVFTFTISSGSLTLTPAPTPSSVSTVAVNLTTSTNAPFGYTTTITDDGKLRDGAGLITDVSDGSVGPVGVEEYGIALTGTDRAFTDDRATVSLPRTSPPVARTVASSATFGADRLTTVTFKFDMAFSTLNGSYSHTVTFVSSPNY